MQVVRRSSLVPVPWKNGGGITHEVIRSPAGGDPFLWRLSVAQIDTSGPFSNFTGYSRKMVLLRGAGLRLRFADGLDVHLHDVGDMAEFDGAVATDCELEDGPCTDLNLMTAASMRSRAGVERLLKTRALQASPQGVVLVFAISGSLRIESDRGDATELHAWDLAVMSPDEPGSVRSAGPGAGGSSVEAPLVFFAALDDNSR